MRGENIKATKQQQFILYVLGMLYNEANKRFNDKGLELAISKSSFINLARKAKITRKKERALYKNFEILEDKRLVVYENRNLMLTNKGKRLFEDIRVNLEPYVNVSNILSRDNILKYTRKAQTVFKKM